MVSNEVVIKQVKKAEVEDNQHKKKTAPSHPETRRLADGCERRQNGQEERMKGRGRMVLMDEKANATYENGSKQTETVQ